MPTLDGGENRSAVGALTINEFCRRFSIGRTFAYAEIKEGRLVARKAKARTVILHSDAERWAQSLPEMHPAAV